MSVSEMLNLGKVVKQNDVNETVEIYKFDIAKKCWAVISETVDILLAKNNFSEGEFRRAFKATSRTSGYSGSWVIKKYKQETLDTITQLGQTVEDHTKKGIQIYSLARNFCQKLSQRVMEVCSNEFGMALHMETYFLVRLLMKLFQSSNLLVGILSNISTIPG